MALIKCPECGKEVSSGATSCPNCGHPISPQKGTVTVVKEKKKGSCLSKIIGFILIIVILAAIGSALGGNKEEDTSTTTSEKQPPKEISYKAVTVDQLMNDLTSNAMNAAETYKNQYLEVSGRLSTIDSSGKYISVLPSNDEFAIIGIQCYIKNDEQKKAVSEMNVGQDIIVRGKCTDVGEVLGYSLDIDSFN